MKKIIKISVLTLLLISLIQTFPCDAEATGFALEEIEEEQKISIFERLDFQPINNNSYGAFCCFAIGEDGSFALGFQHLFQNEMFLVYDKNGEFSYGFSFDAGQAFYLDWEGENTILYLVRGNLSVIIDKYGNLKDIKAISETPENQEYWSSITIDSSPKIINGDTYHAKKSSVLVKTAPDGTETVLFDNSINASIDLVLIPLLFIVIWIILGFKIYYTNNRKRNKDTSE